MTQPPVPFEPPVQPDRADLVQQLGDPAVVEAVIGAYLSALPARMEAIGAARRAPDEESVRAVHSLRSGSALLGLVSLAEACAALETALRAEPHVAVPDLAQAVLDEAEVARQALETH